jgi:hypothetical protein
MLAFNVAARLPCELRLSRRVRALRSLDDLPLTVLTSMKPITFLGQQAGNFPKPGLPGSIEEYLCEIRSAARSYA